MPTHLEAFLSDERKKFWKNRNVFVTGGFGLLGSQLVELLDAMNANVFVLKWNRDRYGRLFETEAIKRVKVIEGDLDDAECIHRIVNENAIESIIHVGAQPIAPIANRFPVPTLRTNIMGTVNVLEAARLSPTVKRVVIASSDKAYGAQPVLPYSEMAPLQGTHPYDVSKSCADLIAQMYHITFKTPVCITRCGNLYGPGDLNWSRIIPDTIKRITEGDVPTIRSDGKWIRDYFFVKDAAMAYLTLAQQMDRPELHGQAFNFSTGNRFTVLDIVDKVLQAMGSKAAPVILNQAKSEIHEQTLDSTKALNVLNWKPWYTVEEGMAETVAWYKEYFKRA